MECSIDDLCAYCRKKPEVRELIDSNVDALAAHGEIGNGRRVDNVNSTTGGNGAIYTLKRLKRDAPKLFERVVSGKL